MNIESFRRQLFIRNRESARVAIARIEGGPQADPDLLEETEAEMFSERMLSDAAAELARTAIARSGESAARARLSIIIEGFLDRPLRRLDQDRVRALRSGSPELVSEISEEHERSLARRGARAIGSRTVLDLAGQVRGEPADRVVMEASQLLALSDSLAERLVPARLAGGEGFAGGLAGRGALLSAVTGDAQVWPELPGTLFAPAIRELAVDLGLHRAGFPRIAALPAREESPEAGVRPAEVVEVDPPRVVHLYLAPGAGLASLAGSLSSGGKALTAGLRGESLPVEARYAADRAVAGAIGGLFASVAPYHAAVRGRRLEAQTASFVREVFEARLAASLVIERHALLANGVTGGRPDAIARALHAPVRPGFFDNRGALGPLDDLRGLLLHEPLLDRLRTRFGNLWYRESSAGRLLRDIAEPGGSVTGAEIVSGLSLPHPTAEGLLDSWHDRERRILR